MKKRAFAREWLWFVACCAVAAVVNAGYFVFERGTDNDAVAATAQSTTETEKPKPVHVGFTKDGSDIELYRDDRNAGGKQRVTMPDGRVHVFPSEATVPQIAKALDLVSAARGDWQRIAHEIESSAKAPESAPAPAPVEGESLLTRLLDIAGRGL